VFGLGLSRLGSVGTREHMRVVGESRHDENVTLIAARTHESGESPPQAAPPKPQAPSGAGGNGGAMCLQINELIHMAPYG
jgi:hypothetical protein